MKSISIASTTKGTKLLVIAGLLGSVLLSSPFAKANTLDNSVYTLTSVGTSGSNVIKQAVYNSTLNSIDYEYNRLDLKNPVTGNNVFGTGNASQSYDIGGITAEAKYSTGTGNYIGKTYAGSGGALRNTTGNISADFANNTTTSGYGGGAIFTTNTLGDIVGDFVNNRAYTSGGALFISNASNINANFIGNNVENGSSFGVGGAINFNTGGGERVNNISGNFIGNYVNTVVASSGGAIEHSSGTEGNYATINSITANFIGNYVASEKYSQGGAIDVGRYAKIGSIEGDFIRNWASTANKTTTEQRGSTGGAIYVFCDSEIGDITGDFIENYAKGEGIAHAGGGVLHVREKLNASSSASKIGNIKGNFISNYASSDVLAEGGVFYNFGEIAGIKNSTFNDNYLTISGSGEAKGSVLYNGGTVKDIISSTFEGNYIEAANSTVEGGVIYNATNSTIENITSSHFLGNHVTSSSTNGGVIYNAGTITNITGNSFVGNKFGNGNGGVIYNVGTIGNLSDTTFTNNEISGNGGAIYNTQADLLIQNIIANSNKAGNKGGVIYTNADITIKNAQLGNDGLNYHKNGNLEFVQNDIYTDGAKITIVADTNSFIKSGIAGNGSLIKSGAKELVLSGLNSDFNGDLEVTEGSVKYLQTLANGFIQGNLKISENASFTFENTLQDHIQKLSGTGKFIKNGSENLDLNNDNSEFGGTISINDGSLTYSDSVTGAKFFSNNTQYEINNGAKFNISNANNLQIQNLSGAGEIIKSETGILKLSGNNSSFTGDIKITNGSMNFISDATTAYISGSTTLSENTILNYVANTTSQLNNVKGNGTLNYTGTDTLTFNTSDNNFSGNIYANGTLLNITDNSNNSFNFNMNVNSGKLNYTGATGSTINIDNKLGFTSGANNTTIQLNSANYVLTDEITNSTNNNVVFNDTNVAFNSDKYLNGKYTVQNSIIDLTKDGNTIFDREFNNLTIGENTGIKIDVDLLLPDNAKADTLTINNTQSGTINVGLSQIHLNDSRTDNGLGNTYTINVLDGATFNSNSTIDHWSTSAYTYEVKTSGSNLILTAIKASSYDSLGEMNRLDGNRGFNFTEYDSSPYIIASNLGTTSAGSFVVNGTGSTIVSGDNTKAMFEVTNNTTLSVSDLTLTNAGTTDRGGSALLANNANASVSLNNVSIKSNSSTGNGGAINNTLSNLFNINGGTISDNVSSNGLGGAIYTASNINITNTNFENNTDKNGKNDIYIDGENIYVNYTASNVSSIKSGIAGNGVFNKLGNETLSISGKNDNFTGILNINQGNLTFNQDTNTDTYISGITNLTGNSSLTINNTKNDINLGKIVGTNTSEIKVIGGNSVTLASGDNSQFGGQLNINNGTVIFNLNSDADKYIQGKTNIFSTGNLNLNINNDFKLPDNIYGDGTVNKNGNGKLVISGLNNNLTGTLAINQGEMTFVANSSLENLNTLKFGDSTTLNLQNTTLISGSGGSFSIDPDPASLENLHVENMVLNGKVNLKLDIDLVNNSADKIGADNVSGTGYFVLDKTGINVISDSLVKNTSVEIAYGALALNDRITLGSIDYVMGPIQKYNVSYADGYLDFNRVGGSSPSIGDVNPAIMASPVATQISGYLTQLQTLQDGFYHMDTYTKYPKMLRVSAENINKNAIAEIPEYNRYILPETSNTMWVKPYTTFEKVNLRGGINVSNVAYGTLYGGDTQLYDLGKGYKGIISAFVGYNGAHISYNGISMDQQGGTLGLTGTLYKGNFFTGLTVSAGASAGEAYTSAGTDHFSMLTAGIANKSGYNWEIKDGKLIIQPSLFVGYSFVNTFDYRNVSGIKMDSDALNAITIVPGIKFIGNLKNGWQPYGSVNMVWNIIDKTNVMANDVRLPQLSVKPYVEYGVGVQKSWGEKFTAFSQAMIRNGGRNGIALSLGFRWTLGKKGTQNVQDIKMQKRTVLKEIKPKSI